MNPISLHSGIVITQEHEELRREAARAVLGRSISARPGIATRVASALRSVGSGLRGTVVEADAIVPPLRGYPFSTTR